MDQNDKRLNSFLLCTEGVGAVFIGVFLAAYLGGMLMTPSTTVLHSEPAFRIPLVIFGSAFLILALTTVILAVYRRKK